MPKEISHATSPYHHRHNLNVSCTFHAKYIIHSTDDSMVFKARVQEMIDQKILSFFKAGPNVITNLLPNHHGQIMDAVIGGVSQIQMSIKASHITNIILFNHVSFIIFSCLLFVVHL